MEEIKLSDYHYRLPDEKIARFPAEPRDSAKLLVYEAGEISHGQFSNLPDFLPESSFLFFNDTKVIPARLFFQKTTGAIIEIFLLEPRLPVNNVALAMQQTGNLVWHCLVGNKKRWKNGETLTCKLDFDNKPIILTATYADFEENLIHFSWENETLTWATVVQLFGEIPLPPYFKRKAGESDKQKYQTVYAKNDGAVAAPTAGLHFTEKVLADLEKKGIGKDFLTLHVSAGTFQPIKDGNISSHKMHAEQFIVSFENLKNIYNNLDNIVAVGTTSLRTLESLYWAVPSSMNEKAVFKVEQLKPYQTPKNQLPDAKSMLEDWLAFMDKHKLLEITGETEIFIVPGYEFKICKGLITNYHLPETTLVLLIAAFVGQDWRKIYDQALKNNYRFLSYGDSSLLLPGKKV
jgi:S-adenosylmethionine:tRNA ribosyltransferase-isomerase